jgi:lipopolysaccharide biosynthesis regulator YciM
MRVVLILVLVCLVIVVLIVAGLRRRKTVRSAEKRDPYRMGLNALIAGDRETAFKHLTATVRSDPRNLDAYLKLGSLLRERGQIRQAIQLHKELLVKRKLPEGARLEILENLHMDLARAGRWSEVLDSIGSLRRGERNVPAMLLSARDAYEHTGDLDHALQAHKDLVKYAPSAAEPSPGMYRAHLGLLALRNGDRARAKTEFQGALIDDPRAVLANLFLGDIAAEEGDAERAIVYWMKLVAEKPECAHLVFGRLEKAYFDVGDFGRMMGIYDDIIAHVPSSVGALCGLSRMLERKGSIDEAISVAREAVKHEGDTLTGHRRLIELLVRNERFEDAAREADSMLAAIAS